MRAVLDLLHLLGFGRRRVRFESVIDELRTSMHSHVSGVRSVARGGHLDGSRILRFGLRVRAGIDHDGANVNGNNGGRRRGGCPRQVGGSPRISDTRDLGGVADLMKRNLVALTGCADADERPCARLFARCVATTRRGSFGRRVEEASTDDGDGGDDAESNEGAACLA